MFKKKKQAGLIFEVPSFQLGFPGGSGIKNLPAVQETQEVRVWSLGQEDSLEEGMAIHSGTLARKIPRTEESGRLQRVRHNWSDWAQPFQQLVEEMNQIYSLMGNCQYLKEFITIHKVLSSSLTQNFKDQQPIWRKFGYILI